jgi:hypothetical protein
MLVPALKRHGIERDRRLEWGKNTVLGRDSGQGNADVPRGVVRLGRMLTDVDAWPPLREYSMRWRGRGLTRAKITSPT